MHAVVVTPNSYLFSGGESSRLYAEHQNDGIGADVTAHTTLFLAAPKACLKANYPYVRAECPICPLQIVLHINFELFDEITKPLPAYTRGCVNKLTRNGCSFLSVRNFTRDEVERQPNV